MNHGPRNGALSAPMRAQGSHPRYPAEPGNQNVVPPQIIYRKNNFGEGRGGVPPNFKFSSLLIINTISNTLPTPPFRAESQGVVQISVGGLERALQQVYRSFSHLCHSIEREKRGRSCFGPLEALLKVPENN
jgi:hypothetical protein